MVMLCCRLDPADRLRAGRGQPELRGQDGAARRGGGAQGQGEAAHGGGEVRPSHVTAPFIPTRQFLGVIRHTQNPKCPFRAMWKQKKSEEAEMLFRDIEDVKEFSRKKMFGK